MIQLEKMVPSIYYDQSRDFQILGRLYDVALNSAKTNIDLAYSLPDSDNLPDILVDLLALTIGFKSKHSYNVRQLKAICSCFSYILRNKGTVKAIRVACNAILQADGLNSEAEVEISEDDPYNVVIYISNELSDISLLNDLLDYILPAGMSCNVIREYGHKTASGTTNFTANHSVNYWLRHEQTTSIIPQLSADLASYPIKDMPGVWDNSTVVKIAEHDKSKETEYIANNTNTEEG